MRLFEYFVSFMSSLHGRHLTARLFPALRKKAAAHGGLRHLVVPGDDFMQQYAANKILKMADLVYNGHTVGRLSNTALFIRPCGKEMQT